jgi:hypothetical protein
LATWTLLSLVVSGCGTIQKASDKADALDKEGQAQVDKIPSKPVSEGSGKPGVALSREGSTKQIKADPTRARRFQTFSLPGCEILDAKLVEGQRGLVLYAQARCQGQVRLERLEQLASRDAYRFGNQRTVSGCEARSDVVSFVVHRDGRFAYECTQGDRVAAFLVDESVVSALGVLPEARPLHLTENFVVVSATAFETQGAAILSTNALSQEPVAVTELAERLTALSASRCDTLAGGTLSRGSFGVFEPSSERDLFSLGGVSLGFSLNHQAFRIFDLDGCAASGLSALLKPTKRPDAILAHSDSHAIYRSGDEAVLLSYAGEELTLGAATGAGLIGGEQPYAVVSGSLRVYD